MWLNTIATFLLCVSSSTDTSMRREMNHAKIKLNDDSCADESRDEALKDCFVEVNKEQLREESRTKPIPKVRRIHSLACRQ